MNIIWKDSPNQDDNRKQIKLVVLHWFGTGTLESANARFQNPASQVSAHYGVSGNTVYQWVKEDAVAYHAGVYSVNQESIGIEHDATTEHLASEDTYKTSIQLVAEICKRYNIPIDREHIRKHSEFKATQCCGTLDIDRIVREAKLFISPTLPILGITKEQIIIDVYKALTGEFPNDSEKAWRLSQNLNTTELIEDICRGDSRFRIKWGTTNQTTINKLQAEIKALQDSTQVLQGKLAQVKVLLQQALQVV